MRPLSLLTRMTSLNMNGNMLVDVDEDLREMRMLEELDLSRNKIVSLASSISTMTALKRLIISHNPIQALPYGLWALNNLQLLEVTGCDIQFPPQDVVSKGVKSLLNFQRMLERGRSPPRHTLSVHALQFFSVGLCFPQKVFCVLVLICLHLCWRGWRERSSTMSCTQPL